jgi:hypothetical protein
MSEVSKRFREVSEGATPEPKQHPRALPSVFEAHALAAHCLFVFN